MALVPERDLGIAILWNSDSNLPSGLLPTILDRAMGLPAQQWLDTPIGSDLLLVESTDAPDDESGTSATKAAAGPK